MVALIIPHCTSFYTEQREQTISTVNQSAELPQALKTWLGGFSTSWIKTLADMICTAPRGMLYILCLTLDDAFVVKGLFCKTQHFQDLLP